tara:strand:- start:2306 stop:2419 length:114 start_codon:yes stop_codon:yes gene_type:complete
MNAVKQGILCEALFIREKIIGKDFGISKPATFRHERQ